MTLIMPTSASRKATVVTDQTPAGASGKIVSLFGTNEKTNPHGYKPGIVVV